MFGGCLGRIGIVAALAVAVAAGPARAQTSTAFVNETGFAFNGLTVSIASCNYIVNGTSTSCSSDGVKLTQVADGRGKVLLELLPTSGSTLFSNATAGTLNGVQFTLSVATNSPSTALISSYALNLTGTNTNGSANNLYGTAGSNSEIIASLATNATTASASQTFGTAVSSLSVSAGLLDSPASSTGFTLTSASFLFTTVPEPASLSLLAAGIGGIAVVARRRRAKVRLLTPPGQR